MAPLLDGYTREQKIGAVIAAFLALKFGLGPARGRAGVSAPGRLSTRTAAGARTATRRTLGGWTHRWLDTHPWLDTNPWLDTHPLSRVRDALTAEHALRLFSAASVAQGRADRLAQAFAQLTCVALGCFVWKVGMDVLDLDAAGASQAVR